MEIPQEAQELFEEVKETLTVQERADFILEAVEDPELRDELCRQHGWPTGMDRDELLDMLLSLYSYAPMDGESQHG